MPHGAPVGRIVSDRYGEAGRKAITAAKPYGYYRNLLGLKPIGILLNLLSLGAAAAIVHYQPEFAALSIRKLVLLGGLPTIHLMYFMFGVSRKAMLDASAIYAGQLILSTETLMKRG